MNAIQILGVGSVTIEQAPSAIQQRDVAIKDARIITKVCDAFTQQAAADSLRGLKSIAKSVEATRQQVKAPVLDIGRRIDSTAAEFLSPVNAEAERLQKLLTSYEVEQRRIAEAAEAERLAKLRKEQEEERKRQDAIRRQIEAEQDEARKKQLEQHRIEQAQASLERQATVAEAPAVVAEKAAGTVVRDTWTFEVLDIDMVAKHRRDLVDITLKRGEILAKIRAGERNIPGLRIFSEVKVSVRQ